MRKNPLLIDSDSGLNALSERLSRTDVIAVDTEFHGEKRYWPELLLLQLADEQEGPVAVDPLAVSDLDPLRSVMEDHGITKVFHSARNDLSLLMREIGCGIRNIFDTQIAAAFLGYGEQISLTRLIRKLCGNSSHSSFSLSDWSLRPLSEGQLDYALDDVRYLLQMYRTLSSQLDETGRTEWFADEIEALSDPSAYSISMVSVFRKARSAGKVKRRNLPVLWSLVRWREGIAQEKDRPRHSIIRDSQLCRIAAMSPSKPDSLQRLRGLPSGFVERYGSHVVDTVREAVESPPDDVPEIPDNHTEAGTSARQDILRIYLKQKSAMLGIAPSLLLPRETLRSLLAAPPATLDEFMNREDISGWRKKVLGEELMALLSGKMALALDCRPSRGITIVRIE
jgi:ribonuclease D